MDTLELNLIQAIKNGTSYDYVANNWHLMSNEVKRRLCLELIYELEECDDKIAHRNNVAEELIEDWNCWN